MDVRTLLVCCGTRLLALGGTVFVFMFLPVASMVTTGCGSFPGYGTLSGTVSANDTVTEPVDLSSGGGATCDESYYNDSLSFGFDLDAAAVEAVEWSADVDASFAAGWAMTSNASTILIISQILPASMDCPVKLSMPSGA